MTRPIVPDDGPPQTRPVVDVRTLWAGGVATAIVAALVALFGVLVCSWRGCRLRPGRRWPPGWPTCC